MSANLPRPAFTRSPRQRNARLVLRRNRCDAMCASIVLLAASGMTNLAIAKRLVSVAAETLVIVGLSVRPGLLPLDA